MLNCDDPDVFENYDYEVIPGGCRTTDPDSGESEDTLCVYCCGGHPGYCEWYPKATAMAKALPLKKAIPGSDEITILLK